MATTTNYSWETPDDTDLVKDGAAAIRTLGSSIDTTTKALNPSTTLGDIEYRSSTANTNTRLPIGTTGQVLAVVGGVPAWATTADQTPLTTKGDIFTFTTVDARLGVGTNGQVLTADSAEATGLKWETPSAVGYAPDMFRVTKNGDQTGVSAGVWTKVTSWTEAYDIGADFATPTWTCPATGYYSFSVSLRTYSTTTATGNRQEIALYKNGSANTYLAAGIGATDITLAGTTTMYLSASDTIEVYVSNDNTSSTVDASRTTWVGQFVRS